MLNSMNTGPGSHATYPAPLDASLDEPLSPWLWLVKRLLVVPPHRRADLLVDRHNGDDHRGPSG